MNKIILIGNLGREPEMSYTANGVAVTKFTLAVTRRFGKSASGERETDWFNIVAWNQLAETCNNYLKKGQKVYVEGRLEQRKYTDKDGNPRTAIDVVINDMEMLTPKNQQPGGSGSDSYSNPDDLGELDDHPF
ncbi:hypothetical protein KDW_16690 [Dictyobacter vulcani]|uniref:Single-stranded DNA-binding protein n=1 Tax=Dictyobacter vulcani TaxID=2607529 RepID=A0A5J4KM59_9CHLR|nr:single-stranded DNA-binding protein [Dictyobacter vulcani]GER87507.1 hypothetical protein KDW_16690 [Dictyobacter vulcani]